MKPRRQTVVRPPKDDGKGEASFTVTWRSWGTKGEQTIKIKKRLTPEEFSAAQGKLESRLKVANGIPWPFFVRTVTLEGERFVFKKWLKRGNGAKITSQRYTGPLRAVRR